MIGIVEYLILVIISVIGIFAMKKIQSEIFRLYTAYVITIDVFMGVFIAFLYIYVRA